MQNIEAVIQFLNQRELSVTTAESCTAGLAAAMMADISGCGTALQSGFVVYTEEAKHNYLNVSLQTIQTFGLTSEEVAKEMAIGALHKSSADIVLAITGTAESDDDLNGVICFAYAVRTPNGYRLLSESKSFNGDRNQVRRAAATHALVSLPVVYEKIQSYPEIPSP
ncbi:MAG: CinA domain protein [Cellvibrio sp.]|jgi:PncC family amidohydrolase|nr:CinA domain protein [Cellvibrio sp.]MDF3011925.1 CinA domain protein [Cellvibrio sp.]